MLDPMPWGAVLALALAGDGCVPRTYRVDASTAVVFCRPGDALIVARPGYEADGFAGRVVHGARCDEIEVRRGGYVAYYGPPGVHRRTRVVCVRKGARR